MNRWIIVSSIPFFSACGVMKSPVESTSMLAGTLGEVDGKIVEEYHGVNQSDGASRCVFIKTIAKDSKAKSYLLRGIDSQGRDNEMEYSMSEGGSSLPDFREIPSRSNPGYTRIVYQEEVVKTGANSGFRYESYLLQNPGKNEILGVIKQSTFSRVPMDRYGVKVEINCINLKLVSH